MTPNDIAQNPPINLDAERGALGCILTAPGTMATANAISSMSSTLFVSAANQEIFRAIKAIHVEGHQPDFAMVAGRVGLACRDALTNALNYVPSPVALGHYLAELRQYAAARATIHAALSVVAALRESPQDAGAMHRLRDGVDKALRSVHSADSIEDQYEALLRDLDDDRAASKAGRGVGVPTGFAKLDEILGGWRAGLHIVAGARSMGKTTFATSNIIAAMRYGTKVRYVCRDMPVKTCAVRIVSQITRVGSSQYLKQLHTDEQHKKLREVVIRSMGAGLVFDDESRSTKDIIESAEASADDWDMLVVDHLQAIRGRAPIYDRVTETVYELKALALKYKRPVIALCQVPKMERNKDGGLPPPTLQDLKGSADIADAALTVTMPFRPRAGPYGGGTDRNASIIIAKNQEGACGTVGAFWDAEIPCYVEDVAQLRMGFDD